MMDSTKTLMSNSILTDMIAATTSLELDPSFLDLFGHYHNWRNAHEKFQVDEDAEKLLNLIKHDTFWSHGSLGFSGSHQNAEQQASE